MADVLNHDVVKKGFELGAVCNEKELKEGKTVNIKFTFILDKAVYTSHKSNALKNDVVKLLKDVCDELRLEYVDVRIGLLCKDTIETKVKYKHKTENVLTKNTQTDAVKSEHRRIITLRKK